jgi:hypothetical protein
MNGSALLRLNDIPCRETASNGNILRPSCDRIDGRRLREM